MEKLFFVVPVYNVEKYLSRCVNSLLGQTYENIQIVLVDDGATDNSGKICDEYAEGSPKVKVIHQANGGLSAARNTGIEYCLKNKTGDAYIAFIDSDDFVNEEFGEYLIRLSERYQASLVQCEYEKGCGESFSDCRDTAYEYSADYTEALLGYDFKSQVIPKLYKLSLFENGIRFPVGMLNEDEFTSYKAVCKAKKVAFTDKRLYYYYQRPGSIMDVIAKNLKNNPHRNDWLMAYMERYLFFEDRGESVLMLRTLEKICTDIILRYSEQMYLSKKERDDALNKGEYIRTYRFFYKQMIKRRGMPLRRRLIHTMFYILPISGYVASRFTTLRK